MFFDHKIEQNDFCYLWKFFIPIWGSLKSDLEFEKTSSNNFYSDFSQIRFFIFLKKSPIWTFLNRPVVKHFDKNVVPCKQLFLNGCLRKLIYHLPELKKTRHSRRHVENPHDTAVFRG